MQIATHLQRENPPPECPPGWEAGPPDFVGVGAQRCGTSWWLRVIWLHPAVLCQELRRKEVHFFDALEGLDALSAEQVQEYHRHFPRPPGMLTGEWTPRYMLDPWIPAQIEQSAPQAKVLVLLRDPVDRYLSGVARQHRLARRDGRDAATDAELRDQAERGMYAAQIERLLGVFGRERLLLLQYERCRASFLEEARRTYAFLGVDPDFVPPVAIEQPRSPRESVVGSVERRRMAERYASDVHRLSALVPELDLELWPNLKSLL